MSDLRIPLATYRLQFNEKFRFQDVCRLVPYLKQLGISDIYASPILKARQGSTHGYDVTDPTCLNPELGTEADFNTLAQTLKSNGMGLLLDIVPNHMAASPENPWWQDFLDKGQESPYASFFDTDWLAFGKTGNTAGYRRFFDIGELVGICVENPEVFEAVHSLVLRLVSEGKVTGLRIDHIDGLYDPSGYLSQLQHRINPWTDKAGYYILVEKILSGNELIPERWAVFGTTGYEFANTLNALFVDGDGAKALDKIYSRFTGKNEKLTDTVYNKKKQVMDELFSREIEALGRYLAHLSHKAGYTHQLSQEKTTEALTKLTAWLPVYRTYIKNLEVSSRDREYLEYAFREARQRAGVDNIAVLDFLQRVFLLDFPTDFSAEDKASWLQFVLRWQQLTGAIMAKGFEDTTLYCYNRLISLNEVGGKPDNNGLSINDFHSFNLLRNKNWQHTINTTSTHDTKRSEDVRARINVLSELSEEWQSYLSQWSSLNQPKKISVNGMPVPEPNTEIFLYQTLIGAWPLYQEEVPEFKKRLKSYMHKAVREAKTYTNWLSPNLEYESALMTFIDAILVEPERNEFLEDIIPFQKRIAYYGAINSLAQVLLKTTSPGVPDFYQGTEIWDFSLVDPDNRRPIDFDKRIKYLNEIVQENANSKPQIQQLLSSWEDGRIKMYITYKALNFRNSWRDVFTYGQYIPLQVRGEREKYLCAFTRCQDEKWAVVVVPRLTTKLVTASTLPLGSIRLGDEQLVLPEDAPRRWLNIFTDENLNVLKNGILPISSILGVCPVSLLKGI